MKYHLIIFMLICCAPTFAQKEGQDFCAGDSNASYFALLEKKKLLWANTYYFETYVGEAVLNGKTYLKYKQKWEDGTNHFLYLREDDGKILQYVEGRNTETIRYDEFYEPGQKWQSESREVTYTLLSYEAELKTPYCSYTGLMSLMAEYKNVTYVFYYQKGYGYVGATENGAIISCASPDW
jgi:hypothetical protein